MKNRYEIRDPSGRVVFLYADSEQEALLKAGKHKIAPSQVTLSGRWDPARCDIVDDTNPVQVEGDVWARPQKKTNGIANGGK